MGSVLLDHTVSRRRSCICKRLMDSMLHEGVNLKTISFIHSIRFSVTRNKVEIRSIDYEMIASKRILQTEVKNSSNLRSEKLLLNRFLTKIFSQPPGRPLRIGFARLSTLHPTLQPPRSLKRGV